jgi:hypothetical protein
MMSQTDSINLIYITLITNDFQSKHYQFEKGISEVVNLNLKVCMKKSLNSTYPFLFITIMLVQVFNFNCEGQMKRQSIIE